MIRLIPCKPNVDRGRGGGGYGCQSGIAMMNATEPYWAIRWPGGPGPLIIVCKGGCGRSTMLNAQEFWALPMATDEQLLQYPGLVDRIAHDYTLGGDIPMHNARDFVLTGMMLEELHAWAALAPPAKAE